MAYKRWRRRKRGGIWLPVYGNTVESNPTDYVIGNTGQVENDDNDGAITVDAWAPTFDYTANPWATQTAAGGAAGFQNLHDLVSGNEWRLRRIVGKFHASYAGRRGVENETSYWPPAIEVGFGYIVLKTDEEGDPLTDIEEVNPLVMESAEDPWIFRRKWILRNGNNVSPLVLAANTAAGAEFSTWWNATNNYPATTAGYGSVADGPHIDQKTNRRISRQERLFAMVAIRTFNPTGVAQINTNYYPSTVFYSLDHRFFGQLLTARGNRRNASR